MSRVDGPFNKAMDKVKADTKRLEQHMNYPAIEKLLAQNAELAAALRGLVTKLQSLDGDSAEADSLLDSLAGESEAAFRALDKVKP